MTPYTIFFVNQEKKSIRPTFSAERIYGGSLLAMCSNDFICFYDWAECRLIQRIDVNVKVVNCEPSLFELNFTISLFFSPFIFFIFPTSFPEPILGRQW